MIKKIFAYTSFVALTINLVQAQSVKKSLSNSEKENIYTNISNLPVSFRQNLGQWDSDILYQGSSPGWNANIYVMKDHLSLGFCREVENGNTKSNNGISEMISNKDKKHIANPHEYMVWNLRFKNPNENVNITAEGAEDSHANYLIGNDSSKHKTNVPDYRIVKYNNIYDNIDIQYYNKGKNLEYDVVLKPNGKIDEVQMECEGVKSIDINEKGQLTIHTPWGSLLEEIPESYQLVNGEKKLIKINYRLINNTTFGFRIDEPYNSALALVIDPISFSWGTYVGGGIGGDSYISDITVDALGNVYGTGWCNAVYPVTAGCYDASYNGGGGYGDAYIFKLNPTATTIMYATFLGGAVSYEQGEGIAVNSSGQAYIVGWTQSTDFPTTAGSFNTAFNGTSFQDIFITKLNAAGSALIYSTFVGGMYSDYAYAMELNSAGEVYFTGYSTNGNLDFPTTVGAYQASASTSNGGVYIAKLNAAGSALVFSTFTGNPSGRGYGLAINTAGESFITGSNYGNMDFTVGAYRTTPNLNIGIYPDIFVQKINPTGTALSYSTYLGGDGNDDIYYGDGIDVDPSGNAYVFGYTSSTNFPTTVGAYDVSFSGGSDPFLTKLNPTGTALVYSTFVGSDGIGESVDVNANGEAFIAGNITSAGVTATGCAFDASFNGATDCFVGKMNASGNSLLYYTYVGGSGADYGNGPFGKVKLVLSGLCEDKVYVCTTSHSLDFPTTLGTIQAVRINSGGDLPVVFHLKPIVTPNFTYVVSACNTVNFTDITSGSCIWQSGPWTPSAWAWTFGDGGTSSSQNPSHTFASAGTYSVKLIVSCPLDSITISVTVSSSGLVLSSTSTPTTCGGSTGTATVSVTTGTGPFTYSWAPSGGSASTATNLSAGTYTVTVSNGSCTNTSSVTVASTGSGPVTSAITGTSPVCANATGIVYSVSNTAGSTYLWTVPGGATIASGQSTNSIVVNWGASGGTITCTETNACGTGAPVSFSVIVNAPLVATFNYPASPFCQSASNPSPTFTGGGIAGIFTSSPAGLSINSSSGLVNLSLSTPGTYTVTNTIAATGGCPIVTSSSSITINSVQISTFSYPSSTFCQSGINPTPTITGTGGGTFTSSPAGLVFVSASTGVINLAASSLNTFTITYTTPGPCASSSSSTITISNTPVATFSYPASPFCQNGTNPLPTFSGGGSAGVFSATPAGLIFVSTANGQIDLTLSTPGTYSITNSIAASGGCSPASANSSVTINPIQSSAFTYASSSFCTSGVNPTPTITGTSGGTFTSSPAGLNFISTSTGQINLASSATNSYTITYTSPGPCPSSSTFNISITISATAGFSYPGTPYCPGPLAAMPTMAGGASVGTFSATPSGIVIDPLDGDVDLTLSAPGTYTVTNTIAASGSCPPVIATSTITINPIQNANFIYPLSTYCSSGVNPTPTITGIAGGAFSSSPVGLSINASTGIINLLTSSLNTYIVTYTSPGPCPGSATATITIVGPPTIIVNSANICIGQSATLTVSGATTYSWSTGGSTSSITVSPTTNSTYTVTGTTVAGCADTTISSVTIVSSPIAIATGDTVCENQSINLLSSGGSSYSWTGPNAFLSSNQNPTITSAVPLESGIYQVILSNGTCADTSSVSVLVNPTPVASAGSAVTIIYGNSTSLLATGGGTYVWTPSAGLSCTNCANPIANPTQTTTYCVQVTSGSCSDTACVTVNVDVPCPNNKDLATPNAFSPNGDGYNDLFCLQGWSQCIEEFTIFIYDRWGEKVFESDNASFCWDGYYKGKSLDPAVFVYFITAKFSNSNDKVEKKGNISLIK